MKTRWIVKLAYAVAILGAVAAMTVAYRMGPVGSDEPDELVVEARFPTPGALSVRQVEVGIDVADDWTGELRVNGTPIPPEQLRVVAGLGQVFFTPGAGKVIEEFGAGQVRVEARVWPIIKGEEAATTVSWTFDVL